MINSLFTTCYKALNYPSNVLSLDARIYAIYHNGIILLIPFTKEKSQIRVLGVKPSYHMLEILYASGKVTIPQLITSIQVLGPVTTFTIIPVLYGSLVKFPIPYLPQLESIYCLLPPTSSLSVSNLATAYL